VLRLFQADVSLLCETGDLAGSKNTQAVVQLVTLIGGDN
jgi:hypothetical protein